MARIPTGAAMAYPPGWRRAPGDIGTATAELRDREHPFLGYLNLTPRQGGEAQSSWGSFRPEHNGDEGDRNVTTLAHATGLRFRNGRGACVKDSYTTTTGLRFIELACLVSGPRATSVIVGAAPPSVWSQVSPLLERSISSFTT